MSKKVDENYFYDDEGELEEEEDRKCPPQLVPSLNPNEDWAASHKPEERISANKDEAKVHEHKHHRKHHRKHHHKHKHNKMSLMESSERHEGQRNVAQKPEAVAIEEAVLFDEEEEIKGGADEHVFAASNDDRNTKLRRAFGGQPDYSLGAEAVDTAVAQKPEAVVIEEAILFDEEKEIKGAADGHVFVVSSDDRNTESRRSFGAQPDYSLGAKTVDTQGQPCPNATEQRCHHIQNRIFPGAFPEGGADIEEGYDDDEFTFTFEEDSEEQAPAVTHEQSIDPVSAELVNVAEEERRLQEKIDQALLSERQRAVVAEVAPTIDRRRKWFVIGAILLIVIAVTTALALILPPDPSKPSNCGKNGYFGPNCTLYYPSCNVSEPSGIGDGVCNAWPFNTEECGWDGGDCIRCNNDGYFGPSCDLDYPNCFVPDAGWIGDGECHLEPFYTEECGWDGGDCCAPDDSRPICEVTGYPNCSVPSPEYIGDGKCNFLSYNTEECGWDGGDCIRCNNDGYIGPYCDLDYPNCSVPDPSWIGDGECDRSPYDTEECGWDGGDCCAPDDSRPICEVTGYPNCSVPDPTFIGDGWCDVLPYNVEECGWDGGDCL